MKNQLIITSVLAVLFQSCSSGSSGSAGGGITPTLPSSPITASQLSMVPLNQLLTLTNCIDRQNGDSSKLYFTKISANNFAVEEDVFKGNITCSANLFSTGKITYTALGFSVFSGDSSFDLLSLSLVSSELTFYNQIDIDNFNAASLFGYTNWSLAVVQRTDCRRVDNNTSGTQMPCAGTASTEKLRFVSPNLNYGTLVFE